MTEHADITLRLPENEFNALTRLRDETFPGQPLDLLARKLVQDGLIGCGVLALPNANRSKGARRYAPR